MTIPNEESKERQQSGAPISGYSKLVQIHIKRVYGLIEAVTYYMCCLSVVTYADQLCESLIMPRLGLFRLSQPILTCLGVFRHIRTHLDQYLGPICTAWAWMGWPLLICFDFVVLSFPQTFGGARAHRCYLGAKR